MNSAFIETRRFVYEEHVSDRLRIDLIYVIFPNCAASSNILTYPTHEKTWR